MGCFVTKQGVMYRAAWVGAYLGLLLRAVACAPSDASLVVRHRRVQPLGQRLQLRALCRHAAQPLLQLLRERRHRAQRLLVRRLQDHLHKAKTEIGVSARVHKGFLNPNSQGLVELAPAAAAR